MTEKDQKETVKGATMKVENDRKWKPSVSACVRRHSYTTWYICSTLMLKHDILCPISKSLL